MNIKCANFRCDSLFVPKSKIHIYCCVSCLRRQRYWRSPETFRKAQLISNNRHRKLRQEHYPWLKLLDSAKQRATKFGIKFDLDSAWCKAQYTGYCALTGIAFSYSGIKRGPKMYAPSIDRINPAKGYTKHNCRIVLVAVNFLKHSGTDADMYRIAEALINHRQNIGRMD